MGETAAPVNANRQRKLVYRKKLETLLAKYKNILVIHMDFVGSHQIQEIRVNLRGKAEVLMGKNTVMRLVMRDFAKKNPKLEPLIDIVVGNVGLVFTNENLLEIRKIIEDNKVPASAKTGVIAPQDVFIPAGPTSLDPGQTSFFQALNIGTKIARGAIEIINQVHLIQAGEKVSASAVALLSKLDIRPFFYSAKALYVYEDGALYSAKVLDLSPEDLLNKFINGTNKLTSIAMAINYPTATTVPQHLLRGFERLLSLSLATEYVFEESKQAHAFLKDPAAFAAAQAATGGGGGDDKKKEEEKKVEEEESSSEGGMGGLFGDDSE